MFVYFLMFSLVLKYLMAREHIFVPIHATHDLHRNVCLSIDAFSDPRRLLSIIRDRSHHSCHCTNSTGTSNRLSVSDQVVIVPVAVDVSPFFRHLIVTLTASKWAGKTVTVFHLAIVDASVHDFECVF